MQLPLFCCGIPAKAFFLPWYDTALPAQHYRLLGRFAFASYKTLRRQLRELLPYYPGWYTCTVQGLMLQSYISALHAHVRCPAKLILLRHCLEFLAQFMLRCTRQEFRVGVWMCSLRSDVLRLQTIKQILSVCLPGLSRPC